LREVVIDLVKFPFRLVDVEACAIRFPRSESKRRCKPPVLIDAAIDADFEDLLSVALSGFSVAKRVRLTPSMGCCGTPLRTSGDCTPATSSNVGMTSMT
jgi:hypothetical protein